MPLALTDALTLVGVHFLMSSIQLLGHSMERLYPWVFHASKVLLGQVLT